MKNQSLSNSPKLWIYWLCSIGVSAVLMFTVVLPAETGFDPIRSGELLGITNMSSSQTSVLSGGEDIVRALSTHRTSFTLYPYESLEIKYELGEGDSLLYAWHSTTSELLYELHSEPVDAEPGYADSYERDRSIARSGLFSAEYDGIHGWFWENRGVRPTKVSVTVSGFFDRAYLFRDGMKEELDPTKPSSLY